jgi:hypothetical protein
MLCGADAHGRDESIRGGQGLLIAVGFPGRVVVREEKEGELCGSSRLSGAGLAAVGMVLVLLRQGTRRLPAAAYVNYGDVYV